MTVYVGVCVGHRGRFETLCRRSIEAVIPDAVFVTASSSTSIFGAYNEILQTVRRAGDASWCLLVHEDVIVRDAALGRKLEDAFGDPTVGIVGVIGGRRPPGVNWWKASEKFGRVEESRYDVEFGAAPARVDVVDGLFLALSPWAVERLAFDEERFIGFHGYDADLCLSCRAEGRDVLVLDVDLVHVTKGGLGNAVAFVRADRRLRTKWRGSPFLAPRTRRWDTWRWTSPLADLLTPPAVALYQRLQSDRRSSRHGDHR